MKKIEDLILNVVYVFTSIKAKHQGYSKRHLMMAQQFMKNELSNVTFEEGNEILNSTLKSVCDDRVNKNKDKLFGAFKNRDFFKSSET